MRITWKKLIDIIILNSCYIEQHRFNMFNKLCLLIFNYMYISDMKKFFW